MSEDKKTLGPTDKETNDLTDKVKSGSTDKETGDPADKVTLSPRIRLIRDAATLQVKLMADGIRDAMLIPVSLVAALVGFLRGGDQPDLEFQRVLELGRRSERWINLFGNKLPLDEEAPANSMDQILQQAEAVVIEQYKKGRPPMNDEPSPTEKKPDEPV